MRKRLLQRLRSDVRGVTIIEFAMIAPTLLVLLMATFDLAYEGYVSSVLQGEVQKAGRDSGLEGGTSAATSLNARVQARVSPIVNNGTFTFTRQRYVSFTRAGQAENFTDTNGNGIRNPGECFQDENGNLNWDADSGVAGQGGGDDIVIFTAQVVYPRIFPMYGLLGWSQNETIAASTVLRNQPFGTQTITPPVAVCT